MITGLEIAIFIAVIVTFLANSVVLSIHSAMFKTMIVRLESAEHKLRQIPLPVELDDERFRQAVETARENGVFPFEEFVDDGEIDADDDSYTIRENREIRETNSNGIPIARNRGLTGDELPAE